jgi:hypothetical protein
VRGGYGLYYGQTFLKYPVHDPADQSHDLRQRFQYRSGDIVRVREFRLSNWRFGLDPLPTIPPPLPSLPDNSTGASWIPITKSTHTTMEHWLCVAVQFLLGAGI